MIVHLLASQLVLATLTSAAIFFDPTAVKHSCVNETAGTKLTPGVPVYLTDIDTTYDEQTILLKPITPDTTIPGAIVPSADGFDLADGVTAMCVFHRWTLPIEDKLANRGFYYPLGRSNPSIPAEVYPELDENGTTAIHVPIVPHFDGYDHNESGTAFHANFTHRGNDGDWNRPAGRASRHGGLDYVCGPAGNSGMNFEEGEYLCEVTLPTTSRQNAKDPVEMDYINLPYFLTYYERNVTVRDEISRFLQKNTFGPTAAELDELEAAYAAILAGNATGVSDLNETSDAVNGTSNPDDSFGEGNSTNVTSAARLLQVNATDPSVTDPSATDPTSDSNNSPIDTGPPTRAEAMAQLQAEWVLRQMDPSSFSTGEFSSLRAYWRRRLNPRKEETYRIGESGPHPCEKNSRWRKFAFTHYDVQNSKMLRWGNQDIGGSYQTQKGHRITVERVEYWGPSEDGNATGANSTGANGTVTFAPTLSPIVITGSPTGAPVVGPRSPTISPTSLTPTISSAPTSQNLLLFGDMEGDDATVLNQWPGRCAITVITKDTGPVYAGEKSLFYPGGKKCLLFRPIGAGCAPNRIREPIQAGDTLLISVKVRTQKPNRQFEMYTRHYHTTKGKGHWGRPDDDSYMVSRTLIKNQDEWTSVDAVHVVGDDWKFNGEMLEPASCNHFHLRFRVAGAGAFYLDDMTVTKIGSALNKLSGSDDGNSTNITNSTNTTLDNVTDVRSPEIEVPKSGFFVNPNFELGVQYWKYASTMGHVRRDPELNTNVMVMRRNKVLRQNVLPHVVPGQKYQFGFWTSITGVNSVNFRVMMRLRFKNNDLENGPCHKPICNFFNRPLAKTVKANGGNWQQIITDEFDFFGDFTQWDQYGEVDFILFQLLTRNLAASGEYSVTNFEVFGEGDFTDAPSTTMIPSSSPTNLIQQHVGYVVKYAGEIRTIVRAPFQIEQTGEILSMSNTVSYQLCDVDEVEGRKAEFPNRMNFFIGGRCQPIRHGNPAVNIDYNFVNLTSLHVLDLSNTNTTSLIPINAAQTFEGDWLLETSVQDDVCESFPSPYDNDYRGGDPINPDDIPTRFTPDKPVFAKFPDGTYGLFDSRLILHGNTLEDPAADGGGASVLRSTLRHQRDGLLTLKYPWADEYFVYNDHNIALCTNEQPNFINEAHCKISYEENVCVKENTNSRNALIDVQLVVTFNDDTLSRFFNATSVSGEEKARYLYAVDGLRWDDTVPNGNITVLPCVPENPVSRWKPRLDLNASECTNTLTNRSNDAFVHALETSNDDNPYLRDIYLWNDVDEDGCDEEDFDEYGMLVMTKEGCWENMHPDYMSIYDFTGYENKHAQNIVNISFITNWTAIGVIQFPDDHPMSHFEQEKKERGRFKAVDRYSYASTKRVNQGARYGDSIVLDQFADQMMLNTDRVILKTLAEELAVMTLANKVMTNRGGGTLVCGSPNEVAPDPTLDDYFDVIHRDLACIGCQDSYGAYDKQKATVWAMNVLEGEDQLCQRMAWSLYKLLNVGAASNPDNTESNLYTYDILNRHCFGSYFDILKEMTFSPKMGEQFNFVGSTSTRISWDTSGVMVYPDENYAREIMQLYTIGLHELHSDGTEVRDTFGRVIQTYTNADILSNARVFTGFTFTARRGNNEELFRSEKSRLDPLRIEVDKHDFFPKSSVDGNWIGDRFPLCVDLPQYHFLKLGAKYQLRGSSSLPRVHYNPHHWDSDESIKRFVLSSDSDLYQKLCNPDGDGECNYSNTVTLDSNLACYGNECRVDDLQVVQVAPGTFYEYIRQPCISLSFYDSPKKIITGFAAWIAGVGRRHTHAMCADPRTAVASRSCCTAGAPERAEYNYDFEYHGERVKLGTILDQCSGDNGTVCDPIGMRADNPLVNTRPIYNYPYPSQNTFFWTDSNCTQTVKVREDGMVAMVNKPATNPWFTENTVPFVDLVNTVNFFSVTWEKDPMTFVEIYPSLENACGSGACSVTSDDACNCPVSLSETPAFVSLPSRADVLTLKIGAFDPDTFSDANVTYSLIDSSDEVEAYASSESDIIGATSTIFRVVDEFGDIAFFKNMISSITLGGVYEIRNPPSFMNLAKIELRDAEYEVDAFLTHLVRHPSAAPYISKLLIQHQGISNPSPGFVDRVTQAFIRGSFATGGVTFGNGKYGNLKAVAAAISLDPESLSPVVDEDPASGNIREPLLKVIQIMRSLSFRRRPTIKFRYGLFDKMSYKIGQMVFDPPDQFSFFSCDYSPPGVFAETDMVSPESELLSMSSVVGLTNGLFSLVNFGLAHADGGFGPQFRKLPPVGHYSSSMGYLTYPYQTANATSVGSKIDELSTMMTAGRLSPENKQVLLDAHVHFNEHFGIDSADRVLLKLMTATPEFHTSNTLRKTGRARTITPPSEKSSSPYKAIVYINLSGGADSFNILTPGGSGCSLYKEYYEARGRGAGIGLTSDQILPIDGSSAGIRGCSAMGINKLLPAYKDLFDNGKGLFFANMGHLHKPVTKANWFTETKTDLFSHHTMKLESHAVDAFREGEGPGVLGRMLDILERHGHAVGATAVNSRVQIIDGSPTSGRLPDVMSTDGVLRMFDRNYLKGETNQQLRAFLELLHAETDDNSGLFGNAWSQSFVDIWNKTDALVHTLRATNLATDFPILKKTNMGGISSQLKLIARLISIRNQRGDGINRDVFYCEMGGYDSHFKVAAVLENKLPSLSHAVATFWAEIKAQGLENSVTVVQGSEFGRTITPNSNKGSDHAWGGNYFMFGGDVKGGKILGEYPKSFLESDPTNIGRGRLIPTTSWDALFYGLTQWMGITDQDEIDYVLPNSQNFGCNLFTDYDLFNTGQQVLNGCGGATHTTPFTFQVPEIRLLSGVEQKNACKIAMRTASRQYDFDRSKARCYISDQKVMDSEIASGMYDVSGIAVLNFDGGLPTSTVTEEGVEATSVAASATASDFVIAQALPQSEAPSETPSLQPSTSHQPSMNPSISTMPSDIPSEYPSLLPSISTFPSITPTDTLPPSSQPSSIPSLSVVPTPMPTSAAPSISVLPTPAPTGRQVFEEEFRSKDIGYVGIAGQSFEVEASPGLYNIQGSGYDIFGGTDNFHFMYLETSGDATFTVLIEGLEGSDPWAKTGIMFRNKLDAHSSHYSMFISQGSGFANQYRTCTYCSTFHYGSYTSYSSVWLRVVKEGNVLRSFYKYGSSLYWTPYGAVLSMTDISSNGYYIGVAVCARSNLAPMSAQVSNIQLMRTCSSSTITQLQCDQASNCESGQVSGSCYTKGAVPEWESMEPVSSIFDVGSTVTSFGCQTVNLNNAVDGTTSKMNCDRTDELEDQLSGLVIKPSHKRTSKAERMRIYAPNNCPNCDPVSYILEGRADQKDWIKISQGDLSWKSATAFPRNSVFGLGISSTYASADESFAFTEVSLYSHDYKTCGSPALQKDDDRGQHDYRGNTSSTISGRTCQFWSTPSPHSHNTTSSEYPDLGLDAIPFGKIDACVGHHNIKGILNQNLTPEQCAKACVDHGDECVGVKYFPFSVSMLHSNNVTEAYESGDCILSATATVGGCDNLKYRMEFYPRLEYGSNNVELMVNHNYCRNPWGGLEGAWCYTTDPSVRWEYCDVPDCEDDTESLDAHKEYKITWTGTRSPGSNFIQIGEIEVPGLLGEPPVMPVLDYAGDYVSSIMHEPTELASPVETIVRYGVSSDLGGYTQSNSRSIDGTTDKFEMTRQDLTKWDLMKVPAMHITPSHGRLSVVTGLRIYTANNNPGADPIKYNIKGRVLGGANVKDYRRHWCWEVSPRLTIVPTPRCDSSSPKQRFYMTSRGEIKVKSLPRMCLGYANNAYKFVWCCRSRWEFENICYNHQYTYDSETQRLESVYYPGQCLIYNPISGQKTSDQIDLENCQSHSVFHFEGEFHAAEVETWNLISKGDLPWVSEFDRNPSRNVEITSTYESGDENRYYMDVKFPENSSPYYEYMVSFPLLRTQASTNLQFAEIELPGMLLEESHWLACGDLNHTQCAAREEAAQVSEQHAVRCCSLSSLPGFRLTDGYDSQCYNVLGKLVWGGSSIDGVCHPQKNYTEAIDICESVGARLCTKEELLLGCTTGSGCDYDVEMIWSSDIAYFPSLLLNEEEYISPEEELSSESYWLVAPDLEEVTVWFNLDLREKVAQAGESHFFRCCSDISLPDFKLPHERWYQDDNQCTNLIGYDVWTSSTIGPMCTQKSSHVEAVSTCESLGARLCTREELRAGCTIFAGCDYDKEMIWSSSSATNVIVARKLRVYVQSTGLIMKEVQVIDTKGNNYARNMPARQSGTWTDSEPAQASNAVDGLMDSISSAKSDYGGWWWEVDLNADVDVAEVKFYLPTEFSWINAIVSLQDVSGNVNRHYEIGDSMGLSFFSIPVEDFSVGVIARRVRIQLKGQDKLLLQEVEVIDSSGNNVALNKRGTNGDDAVDGNTDTYFESRYGLGTYWAVDLEVDVVVKEVKIYSVENKLSSLCDSVVILTDRWSDVTGIYEIGDSSATPVHSILAEDFKIT